MWNWDIWLTETFHRLHCVRSEKGRYALSDIQNEMAMNKSLPIYKAPSIGHTPGVDHSIRIHSVSLPGCNLIYNKVSCSLY